jgi:3-methyladenine DNA glycosylase AlkD
MTSAVKRRAAKAPSSSKRSAKIGVAPLKKGRVGVRVPQKPSGSELAASVKGALASLQSRADARILREMGPRYGIHTSKAFGVSVAKIRELAKQLGTSHELAAALWATGWYEARMLACFVEDPARVSSAQMDRWCKDFDNWALCDTACFHLFDRTPHAFAKVESWAERREEFVKRAAFALLASLALHDRAAPSEAFARCLPMIEKAATDPRNFVKKAVNWALRALGRKRAELHLRAQGLAQRLSSSADPSARWVGKGALRELSSPATLERVAARSEKGAKTKR